MYLPDGFKLITSNYIKRGQYSHPAALQSDPQECWLHLALEEQRDDLHEVPSLENLCDFFWGGGVFTFP
jgi:hypothetical protein